MEETARTLEDVHHAARGRVTGVTRRGYGRSPKTA